MSELNSQQKKAVEHKKGPLLVIAGAGTGKTKVITNRIAHILKKDWAKPEEVLALTFTEKAADEMEARVDILLPYGLVDTWISTFHSFGDRIIREEALMAGLSPEFKVLTQAEQVLFFRDNLTKFKLDLLKPATNPTKNIEAILNIISRAKDENISPDSYLKYAKKLKKEASDEKDRREAKAQLEIAKSYKKYEELKKDYDYLDFGDQVYQAYHLLKKHPQVLKKYQKQFKYILVDEFQDTNYMQNELVKLLTGKRGDITVVGDDDQSIYKFRGASLSNIMQFKKDFPETQEIVLTKNYRSNQQILDKAYQLIKNNNPDRLEVKNNISKKLKAQHKEGSAPKLKAFDKIQNEVDFIAQQIKEGKKEKDLEFNDFAILLRGNNYAQPFIQALNAAGLPWIFSGQSGLYQEEEVKLLSAFLRSLASNQDNLSLYKLAESFIYEIPPNDLIECLDLARKTNDSLFWVINKKLDSSSLNISQTGKEQLNKLVDDIKKYRKMAKDKTAGEVLYEFIKDKKIIEDLTKRETEQSEVQIKNISDFFNRLKEFEDVLEDASVQRVVKYLDSLIEAGDNPELAELDPELDAIRILTVHSAKGLEFDTVFIASLVNERFPTRKRSNSLELPDELIKEEVFSEDFHTQEERRLFYVGMTRAKQELFLTFSYDCGGKRQKKPSVFIKEALGAKALEKVKQEKASNTKQIELFTKPKAQTKAKPKRDNNKTIYLSPYKIDDYLTCPLKYKYVNIVKVPISPNFQVAFGNAMHKSIEYFLKNRKRGKEITPEEIVEILDKYWQPQGFDSKSHEKETKEKGEKALKNFVKKEKDQPLPESIEESFSLKLKGGLIRGRWDVSYSNDEGTQLIDFKTSDVREDEKAKRRVSKSRQLNLYAWAHKEKYGELPDQVGLYFLLSGKKAFKKPSERVIDNTKEKVSEVIKGINNEDFRADPSKWDCKFCAYNKICPYAASQ